MAESHFFAATRNRKKHRNKETLLSNRKIKPVPRNFEESECTKLKIGLLAQNTSAITVMPIRTQLSYHPGSPQKEINCKFLTRLGQFHKMNLWKLPGKGDEVYSSREELCCEPG